MTQKQKIEDLAVKISRWTDWDTATYYIVEIFIDEILKELENINDMQGVYDIIEYYKDAKKEIEKL